jgi:hypothetical protein
MEGGEGHDGAGRNLERRPAAHNWPAGTNRASPDYFGEAAPSPLHLKRSCMSALRVSRHPDAPERRAPLPRGRGGARALVVALCLIGAPLREAPAQSARVDHAPFSALLARHVRDGLVDYDAFRDAPEFAQYLRTLATTNPATLSRAEQLAFWINAYNAYTIAQINAHNERTSIKNINKAFGFVKAGGAWSEPMALVHGTAYTLDQIEHEQIRPVFREPRIHFALVCAALGCPPLRSEAYSAERLDAQLEDQAQRFLRQSPTKNRVDAAGRTVHLSPILDWYGKDFAPDQRGVLQWISRYWPAGAERRLLEEGTARVRWTRYDWALNTRSR